MYVHCYVVQDVAEAVCRTNDSSAYVLTTERWTLIADQIVRESQVSRYVTTVNGAKHLFRLSKISCWLTSTHLSYQQVMFLNNASIPLCKIREKVRKGNKLGDCSVQQARVLAH